MLQQVTLASLLPALLYLVCGLAHHTLRHVRALARAQALRDRQDAPPLHTDDTAHRPLLRTLHDRRGRARHTDNLVRRAAERRGPGHIPVAAERAIQRLVRRHAALRQAIQGRRLRRNRRRRRHGARDRLHAHEARRARQQDNLRAEQRSLHLEDNQLHAGGQSAASTSSSPPTTPARRRT